MKVLFTTPLLEHPPAGGPYLRIENSIKALNKVCELHIISRVGKKQMGGDKAEKFYSDLSDSFLYAPSVKLASGIRKIIRLVEKLFKIKCYNDANFIINYALKNNINIIWFGYGNISYDLMTAVKQKAPELKLICDTDSVWSRFVLRGLPYAKTEAKKKQIAEDGAKKEKEEKHWVEFCDITTAVSEVDADYYKSLTNDKQKVKLFSNVIDLDTYKKKINPPAEFKTPCIYFAGYFGPGSPTDIAARWIIDEVFPDLRKEIPELHFYIIGKDSASTLSDIEDSNITITGLLDTVLPYLCNANVALVPLKFESGTRFKILEAAACNIPIVSTVLGAEGIDIKDGENILIADEPEDFKNAILKLLKNPKYATEVAANCRNLIQNNYSINKLEKEADEILNLIIL